jgi:hypothetical protein
MLRFVHCHSLSRIVGCYLSQIVNREYERLLGYSPRDIRFRLDPFGWRGFWRMQTLDEAIAMSRIFFRCMMGLESDFRMVSLSPLILPSGYRF